MSGRACFRFNLLLMFLLAAIHGVSKFGHQFKSQLAETWRAHINHAIAPTGIKRDGRLPTILVQLLLGYYHRYPTASVYAHIALATGQSI
ncbi:hypothetical protein F5Y06DRAFT_279698 [Hypoxylon sp. FL0890]|nr:hypothetical protein F5Y06DRAFT_279698 [Hypoxylon sp. FL0890]